MVLKLMFLKIREKESLKGGCHFIIVNRNSIGYISNFA